MEIAKCSFCSKEVGEVGKIYYEAWEKKKDDFGLGIKEKFFCQNCWKEEEKNYHLENSDNHLLHQYKDITTFLDEVTAGIVIFIIIIVFIIIFSINVF